MTGAVLVSMGVLGYSWTLLIVLKESIKSGINRLRKGSPGVAVRLNLYRLLHSGMHYGENIVASQGCPTTSVEGDFNREEYELPSKQSANPDWEPVELDDDGYVIFDDEPEDPDVRFARTREALRQEFIAKENARVSPCYRPELERPISKTEAGVHFPYLDILPKIQNLEANATLADTQRWEMERQIESLVKNEGGMITVLEKIADSMLARDKQIAELEDRLRDATFILYGGKKPTDEE